MATRIKLRRDTSTRWDNINPILSLGEPGLETDTGKIKYGDGTTTWNLLPYFDDQTMDLSAVAQHIIPSINNTYDLGSPTNQWRDLYVSGASIYLGNIKLTNDDGKLVATKVINPGQINEAPDPTDPDATNELTSRLTNGVHTFVLESDGTLTLDGDPYEPGGGGGGGTTLPHLELTNQAIIDAPTQSGTPVSFVRTASGSQEDEIAPGLTLARGANGALYNSEEQVSYDNATHVIVGAEWNADGWGDLKDLPRREYGTLYSVLNNAIGSNILAAQLVMHDTINDQYWTFDFSDWGQNNGGSFAYSRVQITDPNYFTRTDLGSQEDLFVPNTPPGEGVKLTRASTGSIYNPFQEGSAGANSPTGTLWNADGWDDLSDLASRNFVTFETAIGNLFASNIVGRELVMRVISTNQFYAIKFNAWSDDGQGGGFGYHRRSIDLTELEEGIRFADGTRLTTAAGINSRVKSTASNGRRIEEVSGSSNVTVTLVGTYSLTATTSRSSDNWNEVWIDSASTEVDDVINNYQNYGITDISTIEFSLDEITWHSWNGSTQYDGTEIGFGINGTVTHGPGATVYMRYQGGGAPVAWWNSADLPGGNANFRGAVISYHAFTGEATFIGTIHIVDDDGEENITHTEVSSGSTDSINDDLWVVPNEGTICYRRLDGESKTLKVHWTAKVFYGNELYD